MKSYRKYAVPLLSLMLLFVMLFSLTACTSMSLSAFPEDDGVVDAEAGKTNTNSESTSASSSAYVVNVSVIDGQIIVSMSDGTVKNIGASNTYVTNNHVTVNSADATGADAQAASTALLSAVGIECGFSITQRVSTGGLFGGYTMREVIQYGYGSGVIYQLDKTSGSAYIITNYHVVYNEDSNDPNGISERIGVYMLGDMVKMTATFVGGSDEYDIAVLRIEGEPRLTVSAAQAVKLSDVPVTVGERTMIVGNANANGISVTEGIVSVDSEEITMASILDSTIKDTFRVIRTDSSVNPGNSGGGMFNANAELIGIVNAKTVDEDTEGMGYAIPVEIAVTIADKVIDGDMDSTKTTRRVVFGVVLKTESSRLVYDTETGLAYIEEVVSVAYDAAATSTSSAVDGVVAGGLGDIAGLQSGDIILSVQVGSHATQEVSRRFHVIDEVLKAREGDTITLVVSRGGTEHTLTVTVPDDYHG